MKPNFALTLSFDGIGLLHRAFPGWHLVGDVALDCADLSVELGALRQKASMLDPSGLKTKLVLPNDQVKYLVLNDIPEGSDDIETTVRSALDGATPYAVDDLAYDWTHKNGTLAIAAVARETLAEAEGFAVDHAFQPVSFVAIPEGPEFAGEPYFGLTQWAQASPDIAADVERDTAPIRVIGASKLPDTDEPATDAADPEAEPETAVEPAPDVEPEIAESEVQPEPTPEPEAEPELEEVKAADAEPEADMPPADPEPETRPEPETEDVKAAEPETEAEAGTEAALDPTPEAEPEADTTPEQTPEPEKATAFASIRAQRGGDADTAPKLDGALRDTGPARITLGPAADPEAPQEAPAITGVSDAALPIDEDAPPAPIVAMPEARLAAPALVATVATPAAAAATPPASPGGKSTFFTRRARTKHTEPAVADDIPEPENEKQRMTIFGARDAVAVGGKPRFLGLILTAFLLLFLIGVAAWASVFMDEGLARFFRSDPAPVVATLPTSDEAEAALSEEELLELASLTPGDAVSVLDDPATEILSRVNPEDLSPDEARARYAATGIWQLAPEPSPSPTPTELEDVYQTSLDTEPNFQDAVALPENTAALTDGIMFSPASPPAADTRFTFDQRGLVQATPEGATTPDGIVVYVGRPPFGTAIPAAIAQRSPDDQPQTTEPEVQVSALRPRARPDDMAEQIERNALSGRTLNELASLRPKLRPESAQEAAEEARKIAEAEELAQQQADALAKAEAEAAATGTQTDPEAIAAAVADASQATIAFSGATPQAVRSSLKPKIKPRNFDKIVQRTKRNQQRQADEGGAGNAVAVQASQRVSPKIPTKASVSKRATEKNALKFKRVNLIGVYGSTNNRRALVRMSSGRYKKVRVGDRIDGGRVQAIGDADLQYKKGGRTVVLKMPRG
ncbi:MAG: hypothetical protein AB8B82_02720 [Roseovarius sp.]